MSLRRWLPNPLLSAALLLLWLMLNQSLAPGQILLGALLGLAVPRLTLPLRPIQARLRKPRVIVMLVLVSLREIILSAFNVSRLILRAGRVRPQSQFIRIPLDLRDPHGLAVLSCIINATPGTVWVEILDGSQDLALHVFDLHDEQWWIDTIKTRYEAPLMEIFE